MPISVENRSHSACSFRSNTTWRYSVFGPDRLGKGAMLFTGPDGLRDHRVWVDPEHRYVGEGTMSPEGTSEVDYLWRPAWKAPFAKPKRQWVGETGWFFHGLINKPVCPDLGQIRLGEFRQAAEDSHTHLYQNAWYPGPDDTLPEATDTALVTRNTCSRPERHDTAPNRTYTPGPPREPRPGTAKRPATAMSGSVCDSDGGRTPVDHINDPEGRPVSYSSGRRSSSSSIGSRHSRLSIDDRPGNLNSNQSNQYSPHRALRPHTASSASLRHSRHSSRSNSRATEMEY